MTRISVLHFFCLSEQVEEESAKAGTAQDFGYGLVARATPAASAAVRKEDKTAAAFRDLEITRQSHISREDLQDDTLPKRFHSLLSTLQFRDLFS